MTTNYWIEQHNKEILAKEIKAHLDALYGGKYAPSMAKAIATDIADYLKKHQKTQYKVYIRLALDTGELVIEIP
jgi:hypothetical protein